MSWECTESPCDCGKPREVPTPEDRMKSLLVIKRVHERVIEKLEKQLAEAKARIDDLENTAWARSE